MEENGEVKEKRKGKRRNSKKGNGARRGKIR